MSGKFLAYKRFLLHLLFWIIALGALTIIYGINKPSYLVSLRNNFFYLPVHLIYFYTLAYVLIPKFLLRNKYWQFITGLVLLAFSLVILTRLLDIFFVDPYLARIQKEMGLVDEWPKIQGTFWEQLVNPIYFVNALKGANLIVWIAITIKFFKLWYERRQAALHAELNFLKAQVHPHFLFNTLNNLYALTLNQSAKASHVVLGLSEILRYMLYECDKENIDLKKDVEILESYIALEKIRYEDRLDLNFNIAGRINHQKIAPLLLIPLVENAFKHGISEQVGDAWIKIDLTVNENLLKFKIANSRSEILPEDAAKHYGNIGLNNLRKRLQIIYPEAHTLKIIEDDEMFLVVLEINLDQQIII